MISTLTSRRNFGSRLASFFSGVGLAGFVALAPLRPQSKRPFASWLRRQTAGTSFITPLIIHNGVIYIAGQGAHSHDPKASFLWTLRLTPQK